MKHAAKEHINNGVHVTAERIILCLLLLGSGMMFRIIIMGGCIKLDFNHDENTIKVAHLDQIKATPLPPYTSSPSSSSCLPSLDDWVAPSKLIIHGDSMADEVLMWRASMVPRVRDPHLVPKVAFMFLTRGPLPLGPFWERFFQGYKGLFSIYVHGPPSDDVEAPEWSIFHGRKIPSQEVRWGRSTMVDAERRLLANALLDVSNQRFILLSESCIPLFNFSRVYNYVMGSKHSFVGSFDERSKDGRGRYSRQMLPEIAFSDWRKGSQWFEVNREIAIEIVSDRKYYPLFRDHCSPPCYVDEHYLPTFVSKVHGAVNANRSLTFVDWSRGGSHPATFGRRDMTIRFLSRVRSLSGCRYNENGTEVCFLFCRKISPHALGPLMRIGPTLMLFDLE